MLLAAVYRAYKNPERFENGAFTRHTSDEFIDDAIKSAIEKFVDPLNSVVNQAMQRMNEMWCVVPIKGKTFVVRFVEEDNGRHVMELFKQTDFYALMNNQKVQIGKKASPIGSWWFWHPQRRQYDGLCFKPKDPGVSSFVIGRHTAFTYKGKPVDLKQIGRELNVRYVLEGSVQRTGSRLRVDVQLVDAETANHLWAERFDKPVADLFDMQDEIVSRLANALAAKLIASTTSGAFIASRRDGPSVPG